MIQCSTILTLFKRAYRRFISAVSVLVFLLPAPSFASELPVIGDATSSIISLDEEHQLGQVWVRVLRAQAPQLNDPMVYSYVEDLVYQLVANSDLADKRLTLVLLKNTTLNAFAVPGGIIGIHAGLFRYAETEGQFASVLAHEITHLSQRHYASSLEQQRRSMPLQLASLLGGILLAAASDGDGAVAAIASSQAAIMDQRLAFSRQNEQEADNIGMEVLVATGFDPVSMSKMFSQMQKSARFLGDRPPEFLLTHPITESRIADGLDRAAQLPSGGKTDGLIYQLMKMRVKIATTKKPNSTYQEFLEAVKANPSAPYHYGLALAAIRSLQPTTAQKSIEWLLNKDPNNVYYQMLQAELWLATEKAELAEKRTLSLLDIYPDNHAITALYLKALRQQEANDQALKVLKRHLKYYPNNLSLWYELAETSGLVNDIYGVHRARAEYFLLIGDTLKAEEHLKTASRMPGISNKEKAVIKSRLVDTLKIRQEMDF